MSMTKKHFERMAVLLGEELKNINANFPEAHEKVLKDTASSVVYGLAMEMSGFFRSENPNFDAARFIDRMEEVGGCETE